MWGRRRTSCTWSIFCYASKFPSCPMGGGGICQNAFVLVLDTCIPTTQWNLVDHFQNNHCQVSSRSVCFNNHHFWYPKNIIKFNSRNRQKKKHRKSILTIHVYIYVYTNVFFTFICLSWKSHVWDLHEIRLHQNIEFDRIKKTSKLRFVRQRSKNLETLFQIFVPRRHIDDLKKEIENIDSSYWLLTQEQFNELTIKIMLICIVVSVFVWLFKIWKY